MVYNFSKNEYIQLCIIFKINYFYKKILMKKFLFPLVGLVVIFRLSVFAQHFEWSTSGGYVGVANSFDGAFDIARDLNGNLYILNNGNQDQQCQGDTIQPIQSGNMSTFVHKFDATGNLQWIVPIGPSFQPYGIEVDESGNVYVLGRISNNTITVDDTTVNTTASVNYLVKLNSNGEYIWHRNTGMQGTGGLGRTTLLKYASGTLYFQSGNTNLAAIDTANQPITSLSATFYDPETAFPNIWIKNAATFSNGDLLFVGEHQGKLSFGSDTLPVNAQDATLERYFYIRCTPALQVVWFQSFGSFKSTFQFPIGVCIDNEDNVYSSVLLTFNTPVKFGPDSVFNSTLVNGIGGFIKINSSGNPIWLRTIESGQTTNPYGLVWTHDNTGFWNAGVYAGSVNFGNINLNASNDGKGFIAKMDTAGNFVKAYSCGKPSVLPNALQSFAYSLASNGNGKYYVGGYLNTSTNYIKSCNSYTHNKGFFLSAFTGEPDTIFKPTITQNGN
jgi:hypothetical protein